LGFLKYNVINVNGIVQPVTLCDFLKIIKIWLIQTIHLKKHQFSFKLGTLMKTLYLVRHAKSSWDNPGLKDINRPLSKRGKNDAPKMGKLLKNQNEFADLIITSPAKRTLRTASKIAKEIDYPAKKIIIDDRLYMADHNDFFAVISKVNKSVERLMIVSHNFGLTIFANTLTGSDIINIPTAGIVRIDFEITKWKEIKDTTGRLIFFEYPKKNLDGI